MDADAETYLLLVLSDANLPTGSFVASAGLESHVAHALFSPSQPSAVAGHRDVLGATVAFIRDNVSTYARSALPFARDAQKTVLDYASSSATNEDLEVFLSTALSTLTRLDAMYETTTINDVARRASQSQGVALLTLYTKGFTRPTSAATVDKDEDEAAWITREREKAAGLLVDRLKAMVRRGDTHGHLPVCWGVLAGALGLSIERGAHLHLFLHARGLLSAAIRMNIIGPYAAQQLLLHSVRPIVDAESANQAHLTTGISSSSEAQKLGECIDVFENNEQLPATTWPLGEILTARHDLLHSRIFNS